MGAGSSRERIVRRASMGEAAKEKERGRVKVSLGWREGCERVRQTAFAAGFLAFIRFENSEPAMASSVCRSKWGPSHRTWISPAGQGEKKQSVACCQTS